MMEMLNARKNDNGIGLRCAREDRQDREWTRKQTITNQRVGQINCFGMRTRLMRGDGGGGGVGGVESGRR